MPDWPHRLWRKKAMSMSRGDLRFPRYTKLFELNQKSCKGTLWPTRVVSVCGHSPRCPRVLSRTVTIPRNTKRVHLDLRVTVYIFSQWEVENAHSWVDLDREPESTIIRDVLRKPKLAFVEPVSGPLFPPRRQRQKPLLPGDSKGRRRKRAPHRRAPPVIRDLIMRYLLSLPNHPPGKQGPPFQVTMEARQ